MPSESQANRPDSVPVITGGVDSRLRVRLEPREATETQIQEATTAGGRTGASRYESVEDSLRQIREAKRPHRKRIEAWYTHPDERVALAAMKSLGQEAGGRTLLEDRITRELEEGGVAWSPIIDRFQMSWTTHLKPHIDAVEELAREGLSEAELQALIMTFDSLAFHGSIVANTPPGRESMFALLDAVAARLTKKYHGVGTSFNYVDSCLKRIPSGDRTAHAMEWAALALKSEMERRLDLPSREASFLSESPGQLAADLVRSLKVKSGGIWTKPELARQFADVARMYGDDPSAQDKHGTRRLLEAALEALTHEDMRGHLDGAELEELGDSLQRVDEVSYTARAHALLVNPGIPTDRVIRILRTCHEDQMGDVSFLLKEMAEEYKGSPEIQEALLGGRFEPRHLVGLLPFMSEGARERWVDLVFEGALSIDRLSTIAVGKLLSVLEVYEDLASEERLLRLCETKGGVRFQKRIAAHPKAGPKLWSFLLDRDRSPALRAMLVRFTKILDDPELAKRVGRTTSTKVMSAAVGGQEVDSDTRERFFKKLAEKSPEDALRAARQEGVAEDLSPEAIVPLMTSDDQEVREKSISILGRAGKQKGRKGRTR